MIRIDRDRLDEEGRPIRPSEAWFEKSASATEKAILEGKDHKVTKYYRHDDVRKALEKLFHGKCAYCECRLPEDTEHYRPKGAVAEFPDHPGYYWLAYTWDNLYPACAACNQKRRDRASWDHPETRPAAGKGTSFPLLDESERAMKPEDDLDRERPCLLDPCSKDVDPEQHLRYDVLGEIHPRLPKDLRAQATIRICHLRRRRLREERARVIETTMGLVRALEGLRAKLSPDDPDIVAVQRMLDRMVRDDALHAGASRCVVRDPGAF